MNTKLFRLRDMRVLICELNDEIGRQEKKIQSKNETLEQAYLLVKRYEEKIAALEERLAARL